MIYRRCNICNTIYEYEHPANIPPGDIVEMAEHRFFFYRYLVCGDACYGIMLNNQKEVVREFAIERKLIIADKEKRKSTSYDTVIVPQRRSSLNCHVKRRLNVNYYDDTEADVGSIKTHILTLFDQEQFQD